MQNDILDKAQVLDIFRTCDAILEGYFTLSSGLRSPIFLQKALVFRQPKKPEILCQALTHKIQKSEHFADVSQIVSTVMGGALPAAKPGSRGLT